MGGLQLGFGITLVDGRYHAYVNHIIVKPTNITCMCNIRNQRNLERHNNAENGLSVWPILHHIFEHARAVHPH